MFYFSYHHQLKSFPTETFKSEALWKQFQIPLYKKICLASESTDHMVLMLKYGDSFSPKPYYEYDIETLVDIPSIPIMKSNDDTIKMSPLPVNLQSTWSSYLQKMNTIRNVIVNRMATNAGESVIIVVDVCRLHLLLMSVMYIRINAIPTNNISSWQ